MARYLVLGDPVVALADDRGTSLITRPGDQVGDDVQPGAVRLPRTFGEGRLDSETLLHAAAGNGARAIGEQDRLDSVEPGKWADLLVVREDRILFPPGVTTASRSSTWWSTGRRRATSTPCSRTGGS
jgi:hypothetical protein